ncbi:MAG: 50S ribosomal protein L3 [Patescibacteria group bacterium]
MKILIGEKIGMTQVFDTAGNAVGATVLKVWPSTVVRLRTKERDGYEAMQVGAGTAKEARVGKAVLGQTKGTAYRVLAEFPKASDDIAVGATLGTDQVDAGELVNVTSVSKGKGFQGTVKRHNFSRGPKTHGSRNYRAPGSIGGTGASRVFPGQKMPGRMGNEQVTTRNLAVLSVDAEEGLLILRGGVPGPRGSVVTIRGTGAQTKVPPAQSAKQDGPKADDQQSPLADEAAAPAEEPKAEAKAETPAEAPEDGASKEEAPRAGAQDGAKADDKAGKKVDDKAGDKADEKPEKREQS